MTVIYLVPEWFFGFDIALKLVFAAVAFFVALYAYRINYIIKSREIRLWMVSFLLISVSYLVKAYINLFMLSEVKAGLRALTIEGLNTVGLIGTYAHIILFTAGLITLAYITFKVKSVRIYSLMLALSIAVLVLSPNKAMVFNLLSSLLVLYVCVHYALEYWKTKNRKTLLILIAFIALFWSGIGFAFAPNYYFNYVIGHFLEMVSYLLIAVSLLLTRRY